MSSLRIRACTFVILLFGSVVAAYLVFLPILHGAREQVLWRSAIAFALTLVIPAWAVAWLRSLGIRLDEAGATTDAKIVAIAMLTGLATALLSNLALIGWFLFSALHPVMSQPADRSHTWLHVLVVICSIGALAIMLPRIRARYRHLSARRSDRP